VSLTVNATDPDNDSLTYSYSPTGGEIFGEGASVSWKLGDQPYATYSNTVTVTDSKGASSSATLKVTVMRCEGCRNGDFPCPIFAVFGGEEVTYRGELLNFHARVPEGYFESRPIICGRLSAEKFLKVNTHLGSRSKRMALLEEMLGRLLRWKASILLA
jgi:hypothetical protein